MKIIKRTLACTVAHWLSGCCSSSWGGRKFILKAFFKIELPANNNWLSTLISHDVLGGKCNLALYRSTVWHDYCNGCVGAGAAGREWISDSIVRRVCSAEGIKDRLLTVEYTSIRLCLGEFCTNRTSFQHRRVNALLYSETLNQHGLLHSFRLQLLCMQTYLQNTTRHWHEEGSPCLHKLLEQKSFGKLWIRVK